MLIQLSKIHLDIVHIIKYLTHTNDSRPTKVLNKWNAFTLDPVTHLTDPQEVGMLRS